MRFTLSSHHTLQHTHKGNAVSVNSQSISPVLCQLQCDIFTAFSHAPPESLCQPLQCPHCTHLHQTHTYIFESLLMRTHKQKNSYMCQCSHRVLCTVAWGPGPLTVPVSYSAHDVCAASSVSTTLNLAAAQFKVKKNVFLCCGFGVKLNMLWISRRSPAMDSCTIAPFPPTVGHSGDRKRPQGPADMSRSSSGSAHIQLFLSLTCQEKEDRELKVECRQPHSVVLKRKLNYLRDRALVQTMFSTGNVSATN